MAQHHITHDCGHTVTHNLTGNAATRKSREEWLAGTDCAECYKAAKRAVQLVDAAKQTAHLPALTGTDKQIKWAITIRAEKVAELDELLTKCKTLEGTVPAEQAANIYNAIETARDMRDAGWWIDHRNCSGRELAQKFHTEAS